MRNIVLTIFMAALMPMVNVYGDQDAYENFAFGRIVSISNNQLIVNEVDFEADEIAEIQVTYIVSLDVVLENIQALSELMEDDEVEITYVEEEGQKKVTIISKVSSMEWDEETPELE